jgi:hypothetical protein
MGGCYIKEIGLMIKETELVYIVMKMEIII